MVNNEYNPDDSITKAKFAELVVKIVFGADTDAGFIDELVETGLIDKEVVSSKEFITRGEAAYIVNTILSNPNFKIITVFATSDIHAHLEPYKASGRFPSKDKRYMVNITW